MRGASLNGTVGIAAIGEDSRQPARSHHVREVLRPEVVELDRIRLVERAALATALDGDLRRACRAEAAGRRVVGLIAHALLRRRAYVRLGFARLSDYAGERLGVSARALQSSACIAARLEALPAIAAAFAAGALSWTQVRVLAAVAEPADETRWLERARAMTVDELVALVAAGCGRAAALAESDDDLLDGEPRTRLRIACPARIRALWRHALELAGRVAGEPLATWRAAELLAAEGIAGRPAGMSVGDRVLRAWMRLTRRTTAPAEDRPGSRSCAATRVPAGSDRGPDREGAAVAADAAADAMDGEVAEPLAGLVADLADADAFALDARLRAAMDTIRTAEPRIGQRLRLFIDHHLYRALGFRSVDAYVRERLGLSPRKAWALVKVEKTARRAPEFANAYADGKLSWARALTLLPVLDRETAGAWIVRAQAVTLRRLADEVNWVLDARDVHGAGVPLAPPPLDAALVSPIEAARATSADTDVDTEAPDGAALDGVADGVDECHDECRECHIVTPGPAVQFGAPSPFDVAWTKSGTPPRGALEVCDAEVDFTGPATVVALFRDALEVFERAGEPCWLAVERLLNRVIADWEAQPRHRDPVFGRDGWRCKVPACSARRELQDHHIKFRSRGGSNARRNRLAICAIHHHHGIHAGVIRASGTAPNAIRWELGVRAGSPPLLTLMGDRICR